VHVRGLGFVYVRSHLDLVSALLQGKAKGAVRMNCCWQVKIKCTCRLATCNLLRFQKKKPC
jgi:hypothetical protein